ncbi:MAG: hypothetical protein AAF702_49015 [Chloroflexota bacterium]
MYPTFPMVIEFAGNPAAGKSTAIQNLAQQMKEQGVRCELIPSALSISPLSHFKTEWIFDAWIICQSINTLLETCWNSETDIVIFDRGLVDTLCWLECFKNRGMIDDETQKIVENFARIGTWFDRISLVAVMRVDFTTALYRKGQSGSVINQQTFSELDIAYKSVLSRLESDKISARIIELHTDRLSPMEVCNFILSQVPTYSVPVTKLFEQEMAISST